MFPTLHLPTRQRTSWRTPTLFAAAGIGAAFPYVQAKKSTAERDNPPAGKFVDVDGVRLHYKERGQGRTGARGPTLSCCMETACSPTISN